MSDISEPSDYRSSIVSFIDILGFSNLVKRRSASEINYILDIASQRVTYPQLPEAGLSIKKEAQSDRPITLSFSDSIVRVNRFPKHSRANNLKAELAYLAVAQWQLAREGVLVRGGVTIGDISVTASRVFGPALVRAYELESKFAIVPRIVIDPAITNIIRRSKWNNKYRAETEHVARSVNLHILPGDDGLWFLDYLSMVIMAVIDPENAWDAMVVHRDMIIDAAKDLQMDSPHLQKYLWLVRYHNRSVKGWGKAEGALTIKARQVPIFDDLGLRWWK